MKRCSVLWRTSTCMLLLFDQVCTAWIDFLTKWESRNMAPVMVTYHTHMCMMRNLSKTQWNAVLSYGAHQHACCCYSIKFVRLESISWRNESRATSRTWHVFPPTVKICNKIPIDIPHTCAWCVTYQKRNETLFCLVAHINMHAVAIRSSLYGLNRFLDEMGVAQHRACNGDISHTHVHDA
jgi:hypothetical protein